MCDFIFLFFYAIMYYFIKIKKINNYKVKNECISME